MTYIDLTKQAMEQVEQEEKKKANFPVPKTFEEFMVTEFQSSEYLVENLIPSGGLVLITARPGSMKSYIALHLAIAICTGKKAFDTFSAKKGRVLIIDLDDPAGELQKRLTPFKELRDLQLFVLTKNDFKAFDIEDKSIIDGINNLVKEKDINLVIFDTLIKTHKRKENDSFEMEKVFRAYKEIQKLGCTLLIIHHDGKSFETEGAIRGDKIRGSSVILAEAEVHLSILSKGESENKTLTIHQTKNRIDKELDPFSLKPIIEETQIVGFEYIGVQKSTKQEDNEMLDQLIIDVLENAEVSLSLKEITQSIKELDETFSSKIIRGRLIKLEEKKIINCTRGNRNKQFFALTEEK